MQRSLWDYHYKKKRGEKTALKRFSEGVWEDKENVSNTKHQKSVSNEKTSLFENTSHEFNTSDALSEGWMDISDLSLNRDHISLLPPIILRDVYPKEGLGFLHYRGYNVNRLVFRTSYN